MEPETEQIVSGPRVAAVIGSMAAGKDELAHYLEQHYGVPSVEVGSFARELAKAASENKPQLQYDVSAKNLSDFGPEYVISRLVADLVENSAPSDRGLVITGVRTPAEAAALKANFGQNLLLACVRVGDQETRFDRLKKRKVASDDVDFKRFAREDEQFKSSYALEETAALADVTLWNNESLEAFYRQIEAHIVPHLFPGQQL